ncbi:TetR/AcrR family transcriptional regulator [Balneola sp. MJW-20]|uniref:TetR/AcrR family transcriptional regulator n=1 Tax=Gracilimonas aurantiaca TaxID=3234185 RepID=UPI003467A63E
MESLLKQFTIQVNEGIYLKDPESSDLGKKIVSGSIDMIVDLGFENFTFRKLAEEIQSTEASVYRYFKSKHKLLLYLTSWYWGWMEYRLVFTTTNIESPQERLKRALHVLTGPVQDDRTFEHISEVKLHEIVIAESSKAYLNKKVDEENSQGVFKGYKRLVGRVSDIILEINPEYKYPHMLVSTVIEGAHHQRYFAEHLPRLTDVLEGEDSITSFCKDVVFRTITI